MKLYLHPGPIQDGDAAPFNHQNSLNQLLTETTAVIDSVLGMFANYDFDGDSDDADNVVNLHDYAETYIDNSKSIFTWAPYELAFDSPDKADKKLAKDAKKIVSTVAAEVDTAKKELIVISPYFVPRKSGVAYFQELIDRGLSITVVTNSLAANNHGVVHSGYMGYRKALLKMGVRIYEIKVTAEVSGVDRGGSGAALATLHTKAFLVDREDLFVGSFNWDPRSVNINTELGVIIKSPEMGARVGELADLQLRDRAYEVVLDEKGNLRWIDQSGEEPVYFTKEPDTTWWRRTKAQMGRILPIRSQL